MALTREDLNQIREVMEEVVEEVVELKVKTSADSIKRELSSRIMQSEKSIKEELGARIDQLEANTLTTFNTEVFPKLDNHEQRLAKLESN